MIQKRIDLCADVLIIGGGSSGMWAAKHIKECNSELDVLMVEKGPAEWGGLMHLAGGDFDAVCPGEQVDDWVRDVTYYWDGLCEQDVVRDLFTQSYERMKDYQKLGYEFKTDGTGNLNGVPQRGLKHCKLYPSQQKGVGGRCMSQIMLQEVKRLGVRRMGRTLITDLLRQGDTVIGAVGFHTIDGTFYTFQARAVILAAGPASWKPGYNSNTSTGEWVELCWRNGIPMRNFESLVVMNAPKLFFWEGQAIYLALGGRFVNRLGEPIMDKYSPVLGANTDNNYVCRAMAIEIRDGRGPIYLDISQIKEEDMDFVRPQAGNQMMNYEKLKAEGIDFLKDKDIEFIPQVQLTLGGAVTAPDGSTELDGFYICGRCRSIDYAYMGGFGLSSTAVTGYQTGAAVACYLEHTPSPPVPSESEISHLRDNLFAPVGKGDRTPKDVLVMIQNLMSHYDVCLLKSEKSLTAAIEDLDQLRLEYLPRMRADDPHYLLKYKEVEGIFRLTELYLQASLARKESRGAHFRTDYPTPDQEHFLGWLVQRNRNGKLEQTLVPVPLDRYPFPADRLYCAENFTFDHHH